MQCYGVWAGEKIILAAADHLEHDIHVFMLAGSTSPWTYSSISQLANYNPIVIAFYELGHFVTLCGKYRYKPRYHFHATTATCNTCYIRPEKSIIPRLSSQAKLEHNCLLILHFNCRSAKSFNKEFAEISAQINQYSTSLVCAIETWLTSSAILNLCKVYDYISYFNYRSTKGGGGAMTQKLYKNQIQECVATHLVFQHTSVT